MKTLILISVLLIILIPILQHYGIIKKIMGRIKKEQKQDQQAPNIDNKAILSEDQLKNCLDMNNMWIGVADQKAGILLATLGVAFTILMTSDAMKFIRNFLVIPFLQYYEHPDKYVFNYSRSVMFVLLMVTGIMAVISLVYLLNVISPNINYKEFYKKNPGLVSKSYIFYGSVANMGYADFRSEKLDYEEDLRSQVFVNATIADKKFKNYLEGFFWFKMMLLSVAMLFFSVMFVQ